MTGGAPALLPAQIELTEELLPAVARAVGLVLLSGVVATLLAAVYRWYARAQIPDGVAVLVGISAVALYLNSTRALSSVIGGGTEILTVEDAVFNVATLLLAAGTALIGRQSGDRLGGSVLLLLGQRQTDTEVSTIVRTVGRMTTVTLPEEVEDMEGYDPVPAETKAKFAGETLVFPRRQTVEELGDRVEERIKSDYGVGRVDVDLDEAGEVTYLAVGSRQAGIGPTLPLETVAVAVHADPAFAASAGDVVQVYRATAEEVERVAGAEVRGVAEDVVTLAVDAAEADALDGETRYRLVTMPVEPGTDREFASLLRSADETMGVITVTEGSPLVGVPIGALDVAVVAVRPADAPVEAIPSRDRTLAPGETVFAVARPALLRRLEAAAGEAAAPVASATD
ncbi:MAG: TrkA C-terminal domain-containing protein [Haloarculaceae archaeon]